MPLPPAHGRDERGLLAASEALVEQACLRIAETDRLLAAQGLTREQVALLNAQDIQTALRQVPGVTIWRYSPIGSYGGAQGGSVYIRGLGTARPGGEVRVYTDGAPRESGMWGHPLMDSMPIDFAESIAVQNLKWTLDGQYIDRMYAYSVRSSAEAVHLTELDGGLLLNTRLAVPLESFTSVGGELFVSLEISQTATTNTIRAIQWAAYCGILVAG